MTVSNAFAPYATMARAFFSRPCEGATHNVLLKPSTSLSGLKTERCFEISCTPAIRRRIRRCSLHVLCAHGLHDFRVVSGISPHILAYPYSLLVHWHAARASACTYPFAQGERAEAFQLAQPPPIKVSVQLHCLIRLRCGGDGRPDYVSRCDCTAIQSVTVSCALLR